MSRTATRPIREKSVPEASNSKYPGPGYTPSAITGNLRIVLLAALLLAGLIFTYSNHFDNTFHFDDSHAIVNNIYLRDIGNIPLFFRDASTVSTLPANQSYRPLLSASFALDYWLGGGLDTFYFHLSTFIWYILQCVLMYFIFLRIINNSFRSNMNSTFALVAVAFYAFHTANAETINYISARSDSISTFFLVLSLFMFMYRPAWRKWYLYLIPLMAGILVKPAVLVFPGIIFFYVLLFEQHAGLDTINRSFISKCFKALYASLPSVFVCGALYYFQGLMTPETFTPGGQRFNYIISQPFVVLHYFRTFLLPDQLSADTDWKPLESIWDYRFFTGMAFIASMLYAAYHASKKKETRPVTFGILWFFLALLPSSSIVPFGEIMNDHRTFFPYIGLLLSVFWTFYLLLIRKGVLAVKKYRMAVFLALAVMTGAHAYGTHVRNEVWATDESLWYDVTVKSPENGRGLMNYGLTQMAKADYPRAEEYFMRALEKWPYYSYLHINLGILKEYQKDPVSAEQYYNKAISYGSYNPEAYYYFAKFLNSKGRPAEAIEKLKQAISLSKGHTFARSLLMSIYAEQYEWQKLRELALNTLEIIPGDKTASYYLEFSKNRKTRVEMALENAEKNPSAENYLNLSLQLYHESRFEECVAACMKALEFKSDYPEAYNNICSAYNQLGRWDEAAQACEKALEIRPDYSLAANNLNAIKTRKDRIGASLSAAKEKNTAEAYLNLSIVYYNEGMFHECIEASRQALKINPSYAEAYNNICSAYNNLKMWDEAIAAAEKAISLKPDFQLAKNNLAFSRRQKGI